MPQSKRRSWVQGPRQPFSIRLSDATLVDLASAAAALDVPPRTLAQRYVEEGLRMDQHPHLRFADTVDRAGALAGRREVMVGPVPVWEVVMAVSASWGAIDAVAGDLGLDAHQVEAAVAYYGQHRQEVNARIREHQRAAQQSGPDLAAGMAFLTTPPGARR